MKSFVTQPTLLPRGKAAGLLQILLHDCKRASGLKLYFFPSETLFAKAHRLHCTIPAARADDAAIRAVFIGKWICKIRPTLPDYAAIATNKNKESAKKQVSEELSSTFCEHPWVPLGKIIQPLLLHPSLNKSINLHWEPTVSKVLCWVREKMQRRVKYSLWCRRGRIYGDV